MDVIERIDSITQFNEAMGVETFHLMVSVVDFEKMSPAKPMGKMRISFGFYTVYALLTCCNSIVIYSI